MRTSLIAALLCLAPASLAGQAEQAASAQHARVCQEALQATAAAPAQDASWRQSLGYLPACGPAGGAQLARELRRLESSSDVDELTHSYRAISRIRDAEVFEAALDLIGDGSATLESRIVALKVLITLRDPSRASLSMSSFLPDSRPDFSRQDHHGTSTGASLPADWSERVTARIAEIADDTGESEEMRFAAKRALFYLPPDNGA